jgi:hypothetical protein
MPNRRAERCAVLYVTPASAATLAMPQPVASSCTTGFKVFLRRMEDFTLPPISFWLSSSS